MLSHLSRKRHDPIGVPRPDDRRALGLAVPQLLGFRLPCAARAVRPRSAARRRAGRSLKALGLGIDRAESGARGLAPGARRAGRPDRGRRRRAGADGASAVSRAYRRLAEARGARDPLQRAARRLLRKRPGAALAWLEKTSLLRADYR